MSHIELHLDGCHIGRSSGKCRVDLNSPHSPHSPPTGNNKLDLKEGLVQNSTPRIKCTEWEYDAEDNLGNTWTSEWDLVCDNEYLKSVAEMFFLFGVATGGLISGYLSDRFGRRQMLFISVVFQTIFGKSLFAFYGSHGKRNPLPPKQDSPSTSPHRSEFN